MGVGSSFQAFVDGRLADEALDADLHALMGRLAGRVESAHAAA